jgi:transcription antitermination factor NusG
MDLNSCHDQWVVLHVRTNFEFTAATILQNKGYQGFVPSYCSKAKDQRPALLPLFRGYIFCKFNRNLSSSIVATPGVVGILKSAGEIATIDSKTIELLQRVVDVCINPRPSPAFCIGARVKVVSGPLAGTEGRLIRQKSKCRLVLAVENINRCISVEVDASQVAES